MPVRCDELDRRQRFFPVWGRQCGLVARPVAASHSCGDRTGGQKHPEISSRRYLHGATVVVVFFDVVVEGFGRGVVVVGLGVRVVVFGVVVVGFVVVDLRVVDVVLTQLVGRGVVVRVRDGAVVVSAGTVTVTVAGGAVPRSPGSRVGTCTDTLPLSETLGHCEPGSVGAGVVIVSVGVSTTVSVSVVYGSSTGSAVSVTVISEGANGTSVSTNSTTGSSPGGGTSSGVSPISGVVSVGNAVVVVVS
ncbi:hypothetical protein ACFWFQ_29635 [Nocardia salmonicida]|uniref:hypothetical protein n=1 Tax=Nocardia salmonicida TaxID=53431 RepID=UPI0036501BA7